LIALRLADAGDKTVAQIERELGLFSGQLHRWRREMTRHGRETFPGRVARLAIPDGSSII